jgi:cytochrome P450
MGSTRAAERLLYDASDPGYRTDPYPLYASLRATDPVHRSPKGFWVLTRYEDIDLVQRDARCSRGLRPDDGMVAAWGGWSSPIATELCAWMMHQDGADHVRLRGLVGKAFQPAGIRLLRARAQTIVDSLLGRVLGTGAMDVIADLALPLPVAVIGELLGLSVDDHEQTGRWARAVGHAFDEGLTPETLGQAELAIEEITSYMRTKLGQAGGSRAGILSTLQAALSGERLSEQELVSTANLLLFAGFETTRNLIGNGFLALLRHPEELERLRARPDLLPNAVLELLRYDSSVQANRRVAREPLEVGGVEIPAGEKMLLLLGAANRDPARFVDPDRLDVARRGVRPLSFGGGLHFCLGAPLALMEAEIAISSLLRRLAGIEVAGPVEWADNIFLRGLEALPIRFTPAGP